MWIEDVVDKNEMKNNTGRLRQDVKMLKDRKYVYISFGKISERSQSYFVLSEDGSDLVFVLICLYFSSFSSITSWTQQ